MPRAAGLPKRKLISVPLLTPSLSSHWIGLVTPVPVPLARELVESLVNEVVVDDDRAGATFGVRAMGLADGIRRAVAAVERANVPTTWSGADLVHFAPVATDPEWSGGTSLSDVRHATALSSPESVYETIAAIGGERGWYSGEILWQIRGVLDKLVGGPGLRKGRKRTIAVGDTIDFWRVEDLRPGRRVRLRAEMVLPGRAWLTWDLEPEGSGTRVSQTATFRPRGLWGRAYWLGVAPFHRFVFPGMLAGIVSEAETRVPSGSKVGPAGTPPHLDRHRRSKLAASPRRARVVRRSVPRDDPSGVAGPLVVARPDPLAPDDRRCGFDGSPGDLQLRDSCLSAARLWPSLCPLLAPPRARSCWAYHVHWHGYHVGPGWGLHGPPLSLALALDVVYCGDRRPEPEVRVCIPSPGSGEVAPTGREPGRSRRQSRRVRIDDHPKYLRAK